MSEIKKLFLLDTRSTLINKNFELFHPEEMTLLLQGIIKLHSWAILSKEGDPRKDKGLEAIRQQGIDYNSNPPAYPMLASGNDSITGSMIDFYPMIDCYRSDSNDHDTAGSKSVDRVVIDSVLKKALEYGSFVEETGALAYQGQHGELLLTIPLDSWFSVTFPGTDNIIKINTQNWLKTREIHSAGDNKLFQSIIAMEQLSLKPVITSELRSLGLLAIESHKKCDEILLKNVIMLDDKKGVIDLMSAAGFEAIRADTKECEFTNAENDPNVRDTYVRKLAKQIDPDYHRLMEIKISLKSANPEAKKKLLCEWQIIKDDLVSNDSRHIRKVGMYKSIPYIYRDSDDDKNIYCQFFQDEETSVWRRGKEMDIKEHKESLPLFN